MEALKEANRRGIGIDDLMLAAVAADLLSARPPTAGGPSGPLPVSELMEIVAEGLRTKGPAKAARLKASFVKATSGTAPPGNRPRQRKGGS